MMGSVGMLFSICRTQEHKRAWFLAQIIGKVFAAHNGCGHVYDFKRAFIITDANLYQIGACDSILNQLHDVHPQ